MTVRKTMQGYEVSDIIDGYRVHKHYIGYTKREAIVLFKKEHYRKNPGLITTPGKFKGCKRYAPYFYDLWNEGMADIDRGKYSAFKVTAEDKAKFPELKKRKWVRIAEDDNGFVYTT